MLALSFVGFDVWVFLLEVKEKNCFLSWSLCDVDVFLLFPGKCAPWLPRFWRGCEGKGGPLLWQAALGNLRL